MEQNESVYSNRLKKKEIYPCLDYFHLDDYGYLSQQTSAIILYKWNNNILLIPFNNKKLLKLTNYWTIKNTKLYDYIICFFILLMYPVFYFIIKYYKKPKYLEMLQLAANNEIISDEEQKELDELTRLLKEKRDKKDLNLLINI